MRPSTSDNAGDPGQLVARDIVVIGASAGGVEALEKLVPDLPADLSASVFVVLHVMAHGTSVLPHILSRSGALPARAAIDGETVEPGRIYVAPPDWHMLLRDGQILLTRGARENGHRPAIDPLFRTAAREYGARVIGVVLSGALDDGAAGLRLIQQRGGTVIVQDPRTAGYPGMPASAVEATEPDHVARIEDIAELIRTLVETPTEQTSNAEFDPAERDIAELSAGNPQPVEGPPTTLTCPECGGTLWERESGPLLRYACHVGHAYSGNSLLAAQGEQLETVLWSALRSLEERADLLLRMARRAAGARAQARFAEKAQVAEEESAVLRRAIEHLGRGIDVDADATLARGEGS